MNAEQQKAMQELQALPEEKFHPITGEPLGVEHGNINGLDPNERFGLQENLNRKMMEYKLSLGPVEVRLIEPKTPRFERIPIGIFDNVQDLEQELKKYEGFFETMAWTIHKLNPEKIKLTNKFNLSGKATNDNDILEWELIVFDWDSAHPKHCMATLGELEDLFNIMNDCTEELQEFGFNEPITVCSGNGFHTIWKLDTSTGEKPLSKREWSSLYTAMSEKYERFDGSISNASRLMRIPGTYNLKDSATEERAHRVSTVLSFNEDAKVTPDQIRSLLESLKPKKQAKQKSRTRRVDYVKLFELKDWSHGPRDNGRKVDVTCPWDADHSTGEEGNTSTTILIGDTGIQSFKCLHNSCKHRTEEDLIEVFGTKFFNQCSTTMDPVEDKGESLFELIDRIAFEILDENKIPYLYFHQTGQLYSLYDTDTLDYLAHLFREEYKISCGSSTLKTVVSALRGRVKSARTKRHKLFIRVAKENNTILYDLNNDKKEAVEVSNGSWRIKENKTVFFRKPDHMLEQCPPSQDGDIWKVFKCINIKNPDQQKLFLVYLVFLFWGGEIYPLLHITGEKGASKSTFITIIKSLVDPGNSDTLSLPKNEKNFVGHALEHHFIPYDNASYLTPEMSDTFSKAVTGGSIQVVHLYTDHKSITYNLRPAISINGINTVTLKEDILSRTILIELERINESNRKTLTELYDEFEKLKPIILGGIFDILAEAQELFKSMPRPSNLKRMADFGHKGCAIAEAIGFGQKDLLRILENAERIGNEEFASNDSVTYHLMHWWVHKQKREPFEGIMQDVRLGTEEYALQYMSQDLQDDPKWPKSTKGFPNKLKAIKSNLERFGFKFTRLDRPYSRGILYRFEPIEPVDDIFGESFPSEIKPKVGIIELSASEVVREEEGKDPEFSLGSLGLLDID